MIIFQIVNLIQLLRKYYKWYLSYLTDKIQSSRKSKFKLSYIIIDIIYSNLYLFNGPADENGKR